jgi:transglutaminase-like putative cysteine protease
VLYRITHRTVYSYVAPVAICHNKAHLVPREAPGQRVANVRFRVSPKPDVQTARVDFYGNMVTFFSIQEAHTRLEVEVTSEVVVAARPIPAATPRWETVRDMMGAVLSPEGIEACEFCHGSAHVEPSEELAAYARVSFTPGRPLLEAALDLNSRIHREFRYSPLSTTVSTPVAEVFRSRAGVCQDFAHLMIACLRSLHLPARYVSGYLRTLPPPGKPRLVGADASHAWLAVFCPGHGWIDFDPTNDAIPTDQHVTLAWGRDYADVSPVRGVVLGGSQQSLSVSVDVEPLEARASAV